MNNALPSDKIEWGEKGLWALGFGGMITEWEQEGSLEQEFIVSVIDSYYGLWEPWTEGPSGMWGGMLQSLVTKLQKRIRLEKRFESFLTEKITQMMRVDPSLQVIF